MSYELILWISFNAFILIMLALDLGVFQRKIHAVTVKEALIWSAVWIVLALAFNVFVYYDFGKQKAIEFLTGYILEKSLSVDNIFVFVLLFSYFKVPSEYQHKVLFWGVLGALILRAILIAVGALMIAKFHWIIYVFGAFLVFTGFRMAKQNDEDIHPEDNFLIRFFKKIIPVTNEYHDEKFFVKLDGKKFATPLFIVLLAIEFTDLVFAFDSIPAIFAVTSDPFIVYTSNIFAILGLRSLYFALAGVIHKFHFLKIGLSMILIFIGMKMLIMDLYKIPTTYSLGVIAIVLAASVILSILKPKHEEESEL
ncbi:MAG: TerC family protein [Ignavibacteria bacterium]|jgi:tellurite resistance protein TerC|nr:TerC family protein [Ignavibacteria bacterium]MBK6878129.1 TerC family protein [Ignavibacteria bacterium]